MNVFAVMRIKGFFFFFLFLLFLHEVIIIVFIRVSCTRIYTRYTEYKIYNTGPQKKKKKKNLLFRLVYFFMAPDLPEAVKLMSILRFFSRFYYCYYIIYYGMRNAKNCRFYFTFRRVFASPSFRVEN